MKGWNTKNVLAGGFGAAAGAGEGVTGVTGLEFTAVCLGVSERVGLTLGAAGTRGSTALDAGLGLGASLIGAKVGCGAGRVGAGGGGGGLVGVGVGEGGAGLAGAGVDGGGGGLVGVGVGVSLNGVVGSLIGAGVGGGLEFALTCEMSGMFRGSKSSFIVPAGSTTLEGEGEALKGAGEVGAGVEPVKKVVPGRAVLEGTGLTVVGAPEGAALLLSLI